MKDVFITSLDLDQLNELDHDQIDELDRRLTKIDY